MHQELWGYKVEEKIHLGVREQKRVNITALRRPDRLCGPPMSLSNGYRELFPWYSDGA
jgi:hypothetical protein